MRLNQGLILFLMLTAIPMSSYAKDTCLQDSYGAGWRLNFKAIKKPGQFAPVSGYRLETKVVPVYGTAVVNADGKIKLGLYINRSQDFPTFTDFTVSVVGSQTFFSKPSVETATGKLTDVGNNVQEGFTMTKVDCKTEVIVTDQP